MQAIFDLMKNRLAQPDMAFFTHYRDDFFVHDHNELIDWGSPNASYLWFVRESGSDVLRLGVCERHVERGHALLKTYDWESGRIFIARGSDASGAQAVSLTSISPAQARACMDAPVAYERKFGMVTHLGRDARNTLGAIRVVWERGWASEPKAHVKCELRTLTLDHVTAMRLLALAEVVQESGSLFTRMHSLSINGEPIADVVARLRLAAPQQREARQPRAPAPARVAAAA